MGLIACRKCNESNCNGCNINALAEMLENRIIKSIPNLVDVVRCKGCMHNPQHSDDDICPFVDSDGYVKEFPDDDFFCKYGERK